MTAVPNPSDAFNGTQAVSAASYYGVGGDASMIQHVHIKWGSTFIGSITFESSSFPELIASSAGAAGDWIQENPSTAYIGISPAGAGTPTNATIAVAGGTAGGASINIGNWGGWQLRVKVVCTQAGTLRIRSHGKF